MEKIMKKILGFLIGVACCFNLKNLQGASQRDSIERYNIARSSLVPQTTGQYQTFVRSFKGDVGQSSLSQSFVSQAPFPGMQSSQIVTYPGFYNGVPGLYMQINLGGVVYPPQYPASSHMLGNDYGTQTNTQQAVQVGSQLISLPPVTITTPPFNADLGFHSRAQLTPDYQHNESPINATYDLPPPPIPLKGVETIPYSKPNTKTTSQPKHKDDLDDDSNLKKRPCRCGSLIHQRTNHHNCPLNPNLQWRIPVPQAMKEAIVGGIKNKLPAISQ